MQNNTEMTKNNPVMNETMSRYARCIMASKRISWDIDEDVIRGRSLSYDEKFLPDGLSLVKDLSFMSEIDQRFFSQVQGRTYANIFGLVERFINAKVLEVGQRHCFGDQVALEALIRFSDEELKHQELFRRIEAMAGQDMPAGYTVCAEPNEVAEVVLGKSTWAVLGLTCHIELFTLQHYKSSIENDDSLSQLYKDVFLYHWQEESQHAILDEIEWRDEDNCISEPERDQAVNDLIDLVAAVDGILQAQALVDANYFIEHAQESYEYKQRLQIREQMLKAYRWQYIVSGIKESKFTKILSEMVSEEQMNRVVTALTPIMS